MKRSCLLALVAGVIAIFGNSAAIADDAQPSGVTFSKEVSRIFQKRCEQCHRPGDLAPMSLMTFKDARPWAKSIKKSVAARTMPPWHADAQYGKWTNDISMTDQEMDTVIKWVDEGAHIYVCGDEKGMARDVDVMLGRILAEAARGDDEAGRAKLKELSKAGRYQRDVY